MIDDIRKKHEAYVKDVRPENRFIPSILSCSDVDALFAALDAERERKQKALKIIDRWVVLKRIFTPSKEVAELEALLAEPPNEEQLAAQQILKGGGE